MKFKLNRQVVEQFARISGDVNPLHMDPSFARRSSYRQSIVHGMLPVMMLARCPEFSRRGKVAVPVLVSGRFVNAAYIDDELNIEVSRKNGDTEQEPVEFSYAIRRFPGGQAVTIGEVSVRYDEAPRESGWSSPGSGATSLVSDIGQVERHDIADVTKGDSSEIPFETSDSAIAAIVDLLAAATGDDAGQPSITLDSGLYLPNMAVLAMFSTLVGMRLPGEAATFLEFSAGFERAVERNAQCVIRAEVGHVSLGARLLTSAITVQPLVPTGAAIASGRVSARVNPPVATMPSIAELEESAVDLGMRGKVAIVTGASRGIGETIAKLLAVHGCHVVVNYRLGKDDALRIVQEIEDSGGTAVAVPADIRSQGDVERMVKSCADRFGGVDILVNNAVRDYRSIRYAELTWDEVQADLDVNVKGAFLCCQAVVPYFLKRQGGRIVNLVSVAVDNPPPDQLKYVVSKSALVGLTRALSAEFASRNIQVNMVEPNFVETDLVGHIQEGFRKKIAGDIPMKRLATPLDVAKAVAMLASSYSSYTTGQKFMVTGGGAPFL